VCIGDKIGKGKLIGEVIELRDFDFEEKDC